MFNSGANSLRLVRLCDIPQNPSQRVGVIAALTSNRKRRPTVSEVDLAGSEGSGRRARRSAPEVPPGGGEGWAPYDSVGGRADVILRDRKRNRTTAVPTPSAPRMRPTTLAGNTGVCVQGHSAVVHGSAVRERTKKVELNAMRKEERKIATISPSVIPKRGALIAEFGCRCS
jgi:hypothetical protein